MPPESPTVDDPTICPPKKKSGKKKRRTTLIDDHVESRSISASPPAVAHVQEEVKEVALQDESIDVALVEPVLEPHTVDMLPDDLLIAVDPGLEEHEEPNITHELPAAAHMPAQPIQPVHAVQSAPVGGSATQPAHPPVTTTQRSSHDPVDIPTRSDVKTTRRLSAQPASFPRDPIPASPRRHEVRPVVSSPRSQARYRGPSFSDARNPLFVAPDLNIPRQTQEVSPQMIRFDSFSNAGDQAAAARASDILLVASMGTLEVYRLLADKMELYGRLEGLNGEILDAKVLPVSTVEDDLNAQRPLAAILIHGPVHEETWTRYETSLELFSLSTFEHIATLYRGLPITSEYAPEPVGAFRIDAAGSYITLSSGTSGEVWVFDATFNAIGKFWTILQEGGNQALSALGRRWLVIVCPDSASIVSIQGTVSGTGYNLASHNAPVPPPITVDVQDLGQEGVISRLSRQAAQEMLKATRKGVELGWNGWKEFTNPSQPPKRAESEFPPTHAPEIKRHVQPSVICMIDLAKLSSGVFHHATFALESGCNFLSLSPDALRLVTTDRNGEMSDVWDVTHAWHSEAPTAIGEDHYGPSVRCIQRISRNSPSIVVGATWRDDRLAMRTAAGTVHLHQIGFKKRALKSAPTVSLSSGMSPPSTSFLGSITSGWQKVSSRDGLIDTANAARAAGGRLLARGLAQGYTMAKTGVHDAWHADDNKIRLPDAVSIRWLHDELAVATPSKIFVYSVVKLGERLKAEARPKEWRLPAAAGSNGCPNEPHGWWNDRPMPIQFEDLPEQDETETNPMYVAFHVDKRVSLLVYGEYEQQNIWCFGNALPPGLKVNTLSDDIGFEHEGEQVQSVFRIDEA